VPLACRNDDDVSRPDEPPLLLGCNDAFALNDVQDLVGRVNVRPRTSPGLEEDRDQIDSSRSLRAMEGLHANRSAEIFGMFRGARLT
jgi:hypothetical protein